MPVCRKFLGAVGSAFRRLLERFVEEMISPHDLADFGEQRRIRRQFVNQVVNLLPQAHTLLYYAAPCSSGPEVSDRENPQEFPRLGKGDNSRSHGGGTASVAEGQRSGRPLGLLGNEVLRFCRLGGGPARLFFAFQVEGDFLLHGSVRRMNRDLFDTGLFREIARQLLCLGFGIRLPESSGVAFHLPVLSDGIDMQRFLLGFYGC